MPGSGFRLRHLTHPFRRALPALGTWRCQGRTTCAGSGGRA